MNGVPVIVEIKATACDWECSLVCRVPACYSWGSGLHDQHCMYFPEGSLYMCSFDATTIRGIASWPSTLILQDTQNTDHQGEKKISNVQQRIILRTTAMLLKDQWILLLILEKNEDQPLSLFSWMRERHGINAWGQLIITYTKHLAHDLKSR